MRDPVSWLLLEDGWDVVGADGTKVGVVKEVRADSNADIFDGLVVDPGLLKTARYVPAEQVQQILEGQVVLAVPSSEFEQFDE